MKTINLIKSARKNHSFGIFNIRKLSVSNNKQKPTNRWHLSAEGFLLLPSALRPHLSRFILILLLLLSFSLAAEIFSLTDEVSAASIELTVPANFNINLDPGVGTTFGESTNQQISIKTSGSFGYTLNIKLGDGTNLKNGSNVIKTITKPDGYADKAAYQTSNETNTWAYKPGKLNSTSNTKYLPFPSVETLLDKTSTNNDTANNYDLTIAAKVDNTLNAGTYSNIFVVTATVNEVSYSITYNINGGDSSSLPSPNPQAGTSVEEVITLSDKTPTRDGYEFKGWCSIATSNEKCDGGQIYQPGGEYTLVNGANTVTLYAMWESSSPPPAMQNWTGCSGLTQDNGSNGSSIVTTLVDNRDGNEYKVAKLKDGKCWMVENLRLGDDKLQNRTLTSANTDITAPTYNLTAQTPVNFNANNNYDADALYIDPNHPEYGGLYSWHTATAGTDTASMSTTDKNATSSICPKGWKLPTGGSSSDFKNLVTAYGGDNSTGSTNLRATPVPGFVYSGSVRNNGSALSKRGSSGFYWSSTVDIIDRACYLSIASSEAYPARYNARSFGFSVRCVAR